MLTTSCRYAAYKHEILRKRLQSCSLPNSDSMMLKRVDEPPLRRIDTSGRHSWRRIVHADAPVYVPMSLMLLMTGQDTIRLRP
jgi:hypothetical protein